MQGRCLRGAACTFAHDRVPATRLLRCRFHARGECMKGAEACEFSHDLSREPCARLLLLGTCSLSATGRRCDRLHDLSGLSGEEVTALRERFRHGQEQREKLGQRTIEGWRGGGSGAAEPAAAAGADAGERDALLPLSPPPAAAASARALPPSVDSTAWLPLEEVRKLVSSGGGGGGGGGGGAGAAAGTATSAERDAAAGAAASANVVKSKEAASQQLAGLLAASGT